MGLFSRTKEINIYAPMDGKVVPIESLKDETFAGKVMGDGIAIIPTSEEVLSPVDGVISSLLDTKHAYGITANQGFDLLIHVGQDTVDMQGEGFAYDITDGQKIKVGQKLGSFTLALIKAKGYETATPIILIDGSDFKIVNKTSETEVHAGDVLFTISR